MDRASAQAWLDGYVAAWLSYDEDQIGALFTEDVAYRYHPYDDPTVGREAVVASWLGESDSDEASTRDARHLLAHYHGRRRRRIRCGHRHLQLHRATRRAIVRMYPNCFVMRFDTAGRCRRSPSTTFGSRDRGDQPTPLSRHRHHAYPDYPSRRQPARRHQPAGSANSPNSPGLDLAASPSKVSSRCAGLPACSVPTLTIVDSGSCSRSGRTQRAPFPRRVPGGLVEEQ